MRLIGTVKGEKQTYQFYSFLEEKKIECSYEPDSHQEGRFQFWVMHEDEVETTAHWLEEFQKKPEDPRFDVKEHPIDNQRIATNTGEEGDEKEPFPLRAIRLRGRMRPRMPITRFIVLVCALLYFWNSYQMTDPPKADKDSKLYTLTPLMIDLSYDMPTIENRDESSKEIFSENRISDDTVWDGFYDVALGWPESKEELDAPMFVQIRQGEVWRLFTPVFLHGSFLHILFNMLWLWMLGRQVEERTKKWQYIAITLIIGILSNTLQYLISGPLFIGYSGIVCGLAGFIWMRQRRAPWEGYPLQKGTVAFLAIFIVAMMVIQLVLFFLIRSQIVDSSMNIANTAHISGAIIGIILGRIPLFSKGAV
ncbi:MAG: rhomboid family intramembrane serine protease [Candidatus Neptunochlamydia sp.]|nr:rhomboid family intramembrane serine protease [Candidatus Neptunochlamydia sp.]